MAKARRQILLRRTIRVIVEGETEFAFCRHLKASLSRGRDVQVNIKPAHGGSPDAIVDHARRQMKNFPMIMWQLSSIRIDHSLSRAKKSCGR